MQLNKNEQFGILSTLLFMGVMVLLLLFLGFKIPFPPPGEEGILINFGTTELGSGDIEPAPSEPVVQEETTTVTPSEPEPAPEKGEEVMTQNYDNTAYIEQKRKADQKKKEELDEQKRKNDEIERQRKEELEKQRQAEEDRKKQESIDKANTRAKSAFGGKNPNGTNTGEGEGGGTGNQGDPNGDINSKNRTGTAGGGNGGGDVSFNLAGRNSRSLPIPAYNVQAEGKVVVQITVDQNGNVTKAVTGYKGSTTSNAQLREEARKAALKATFDVKADAPAEQTGTITYIFVLQ